MKEDKLGFRMTNFSNVKDVATIAFLSPKGELKSVFIHRDTFLKLMEGKLEKEQIPGMTPSLDQMELREAFNREIKGDHKKWFETSANDLLKKEANARTNYQEK